MKMGRGGWREVGGGEEEGGGGQSNHYEQYWELGEGV